MSFFSRSTKPSGITTQADEKSDWVIVIESKPAVEWANETGFDRYSYRTSLWKHPSQGFPPQDVQQFAEAMTQGISRCFTQACNDSRSKFGGGLSAITHEEELRKSIRDSLANSTSRYSSIFTAKNKGG
jgi:hypothetical protein